MTTRRRRWDVLLSAALFLLLALLFVPECDDCYFIYWDFASWKDFLLVRPIPQEGVVLGVPSNGRYLGNLLGLILGKLAFSPLWPLRVLILGGGIGNVIDRVCRGYVVDMFDLQFISYPIFNLADCFVVVGVILGAVYYLWFYDKYDKPKKEPDHDAGADSRN